MKQMNGTAERCAISLRSYFTAFVTYILKKLHHKSTYLYFFIISFETTSPLINEGGTPGPGTVSCPV